jgi:[protein-PII] uridylyltransferase
MHVADGSTDPGELLRSKRTYSNGPRKSVIEPLVEFDNSLSSRATVFQVIASDRSGLLFDIANTFSQRDADIEVVLLDTQGHKAVDVFYVVRDGGPVDTPLCEILKTELLAVCRGRRID